MLVTSESASNLLVIELCIEYKEVITREELQRLIQDWLSSNFDLCQETFKITYACGEKKQIICGVGIIKDKKIEDFDAIFSKKCNNIDIWKHGKQNIKRSYKICNIYLTKDAE
ncbi:TPA: hypothetical protein TXY98_000806 [Streptococcus suis]|nr:hypothetical protein [Streptococcus suis]